MRNWTLVCAAAVGIAALSGCGMSQAEIRAHAHKAVGIKSAEQVKRFCAMSEAQKRSYLVSMLAKENASGGYIQGRYVDTTVVLSDELAGRRRAWRELTGC